MAFRKPFRGPMPACGSDRKGYADGGYVVDPRTHTRSEALAYAKAQDEIARNPPYSIIGEMINPQQASVVDAIRRGAAARRDSTGYTHPRRAVNANQVPADTPEEIIMSMPRPDPRK